MGIARVGTPRAGRKSNHATMRIAAPFRSDGRQRGFRPQILARMMRPEPHPAKQQAAAPTQMNPQRERSA